MTSTPNPAILRPMPKATPSRSRSKPATKPASRKKRKPILTRDNSDKHLLYQGAVQCPEAELDFVEATFKKTRSRKLLHIREDFCGTGNTSCEWIRRHKSHTAVGLDLHAPTIAWGLKNNTKDFTKEQHARLNLLRSNVLTPPPAAKNVDAVLAMNFSWWIFTERETLINYFKAVRASLKPDGIFFLDMFGGWETFKALTERRRCKGYTYVWEQSDINPIDNRATCRIHFDFKRGPMWKNAFIYHWRIWTIPEVQDILKDAGFQNSTIYWEGDTPSGGGNGVFRPQKKAEDCASFVAYIVAPK